MKSIVFVILFVVVLVLHVYVFFRLWQMIPIDSLIGKVALISLFVILLSSFVLSIVAGQVLPSAVLTVLYKVGTAWFFFFVYLLIALLLIEILRILPFPSLHRYLQGSWIGIGVLTGVIVLIFSLGYVKYVHKQRVELNIAVNKEMKPLKIVALSDLHLGYGIGKAEFKGWIDLVNKEEPDIVLLAGDIIDNNLRPLYEQEMYSLFNQIQTKYGIFAVPGNHEYISGIDKSLEFLNKAGVVVLKDSVSLVDNQFYVVGRDDRSNEKRKSLDLLMLSLDHSKPIIVLDHQPFFLEEAEKNAVDLQLSGHTHHGQIWPISWITERMYELAHGYMKKGNTHIYVSSGIGIWGGKFRIGTQSEYVVINVKN